MHAQPDSEANWVKELVDFLRAQPGVSAVRIDPTAHTLAVATMGDVELKVLGEKLAATIAAVEERLASKALVTAPAGFSVKQEGGALVIGRETCTTAQTMRQWRNVEWPEEPAHTHGAHGHDEDKHNEHGEHAHGGHGHGAHDPSE